MVAVDWVRRDFGECEVVSRDGHHFPASPDTTEEIHSRNGGEEGSLQALGIARIESKLRQRCGVVLQLVDPSHYKRVGFFFCCSSVHWHASKELAQACENKFRDFKTGTVTII